MQLKVFGGFPEHEIKFTCKYEYTHTSIHAHIHTYMFLLPIMNRKYLATLKLAITPKHMMIYMYIHIHSYKSNT